MWSLSGFYISIKILAPHELIAPSALAINLFHKRIYLSNDFGLSVYCFLNALF